MTTAGADAKKKLLEMLSGASQAAESDPFATSLVRLKSSGDKRPFFCVHPGSGTVACFIEVAQTMDEARPYFGLQPPGLDGERAPFDDLATLASGYVRVVKRAQERGPYLLGGWSAGGVIAFEMARQLRAEGHEIGALVMCDTAAPNVHGALKLSLRDKFDLIYRQMALAVWHIGRQRGVTVPHEVAYGRFVDAFPRTLVDQVELMFEILRDHGAWSDTKTPMFDVFRANLTALARYVVPTEKLDAPITLLRSANEELGANFAKMDATYLWDRVSTRDVKVIPMPSHHFAMFHGDVAPVTAGVLRRCLDDSDANAAREGTS